MTNAKRLIKYLSKSRAKLPLILLFAFFYAACALSAPFFVGRAVGAVEGESVLFDQLWLNIGIIASIYCLSSLAHYFLTFLSAKGGKRLAAALREDTLKKLNKLSVSSIDEAGTGAIISRMTSDAESAGEGVNLTFAQVFSGALIIIGCAVFMLILDSAIAAVIIVVVPLAVLMTSLIGRLGARRFFALQNAISGYSSNINESITNFEIVRAFGCEQSAYKEAEKLNLQLSNDYKNAQFTASTTAPLGRTISYIAYVLVGLIGGFRAFTAEGMNAELISALLSYALAFSRPIHEITAISPQIAALSASLKRLFYFLDQKEEDEVQQCELGKKDRSGEVGKVVGAKKDSSSEAGFKNSGEAGFKKEDRIGEVGKVVGAKKDSSSEAGFKNSGEAGFKKEDRIYGAVGLGERAEAGVVEKEDTRSLGIEFCSVDFSYSQRKLLNDFSLKIEAGQTVAIVGPTGAGKSTLVNLLTRFYDLGGGKILVGGQDISRLPRTSVRSLVSMVMQDVWLFEGSVRENIAFGREGASEEEIINAALNAYAHDFIMRLPKKYDTILYENSGGLSMGERQLLTIARAMLRDAPILILDEATSNVDTRTEELINKATKKLMRGKTCIIIAHRLSTVRAADVIVVLKSGRIIEKGSHDELISLRGDYFGMISENTANALDS